MLAGGGGADGGHEKPRSYMHEHLSRPIATDYLPLIRSSLIRLQVLPSACILL